jgi:hypothetical protein
MDAAKGQLNPAIATGLPHGSLAFSRTPNGQRLFVQSDSGVGVLDLEHSGPLAPIPAVGRGQGMPANGYFPRGRADSDEHLGKMRTADPTDGSLQRMRQHSITSGRYIRGSWIMTERSLRIDTNSHVTLKGSFHREIGWHHVDIPRTSLPGAARAA